MALDEKDLQAISALLDCKFEKELKPIKEDIAELKRDVSCLKQEVSGLKQDVRRLEVRMERLEKKVDGIDNRLRRVELRQEQEVIYKLDLLVENFIRIDRVTKLEEDMGAIKESLSCVELALTDVAGRMDRKSDNDICSVSV